MPAFTNGPSFKMSLFHAPSVLAPDKDLEVSTCGYLHDLFVAKVMDAWNHDCRKRVRQVVNFVREPILPICHPGALAVPKVSTFHERISNGSNS